MKLGERTKFTQADTPVILTGIGFFDRVHGQRGGAANGFELHPVLNVDYSDESDEDDEDGAVPVVPLRKRLATLGGSTSAPPAKVSTADRNVATSSAVSWEIAGILYVPFIVATGAVLVVVRRNHRLDSMRLQVVPWFGVAIASVMSALLVAAATKRLASEIEMPDGVLMELAIVTISAVLADHSKDARIGAAPTTASERLLNDLDRRRSTFAGLFDLGRRSDSNRDFVLNATVLGSSVVTAAVYALSVWESLTGATSHSALLPELGERLRDLLGLADILFSELGSRGLEIKFEARLPYLWTSSRQTNSSKW